MASIFDRYAGMYGKAGRTAYTVCLIHFVRTNEEPLRRAEKSSPSILEPCASSASSVWAE